jgi:hypothetical protein
MWRSDYCQGGRQVSPTLMPEAPKSPRSRTSHTFAYSAGAFPAGRATGVRARGPLERAVTLSMSTPEVRLGE